MQIQIYHLDEEKTREGERGRERKRDGKREERGREGEAKRERERERKRKTFWVQVIQFIFPLVTTNKHEKRHRLVFFPSWSMFPDSSQSMYNSLHGMILVLKNTCFSSSLAPKYQPILDSMFTKKEWSILNLKENQMPALPFYNVEVALNLLT